MKKIVLTVLSAFAGGMMAQAQGLSLQDAVRIAQDSALVAYRSENALLRSQAEYEQFLAGRRPQLSFLFDPGYQKFTNEPGLHYYKLRNYNMLNAYGEFRLEQQALGLGGSFYATSGALWTGYFGPDHAQRVFSAIPLGLGYSNPMMGYNGHKWDRLIQDYHIESEKKAHQHELASIAAEAEKYYIACLVADYRYSICSVNSDVTRRALEIGREKFNIASIKKNELFALELQHINAENALFDSRKEMENSRKTLFSFLREEDKGQELSIPEVPEYLFISLDDAIALARENNPRFRGAREEILKAQQRSDKARVESSLLQTAVDMNLGIQNNDYSFLKSYAGQKLFVVGGVTLRIPIFDGGLAKSRLKAAEYNLRHAESEMEEQSRRLDLEVDVALKEFNAQQDLVRRTLQAIKLADESFALASDLYDNGEIDINTFILALDRKDDSYSNYLESLKAYWDSYYTLKSLCVTIF